MSTNLSTNNSKEESLIDRIVRGAFLVALLLFFSALMMAFVLILQTPAGSSVSLAMNSLFALDSVQMWWYVTRAAGLTGYFLMWLSMAWGLAIANKILHPAVEGSFTYDFHEFLSLLGIGFILLHVIVLLFDGFLPFSVPQTVIPFIDTYRPFWVGLGIIGFYLFLLVTVTFYMRKTIGMRAFRSIHALSLLGYLGATLHGLFAGTDSALWMTKLLYALTFIVIVFLTAYWLIIVGLNKREKAEAAAKAALAKRQAQWVRPNNR
jgi:methionine sulfoxide reductase heme-binding subunit